MHMMRHSGARLGAPPHRHLNTHLQVGIGVAECLIRALSACMPAFRARHNAWMFLQSFRCVACMEPFIERTAVRGRFNLPCGHAFCDICMGELMTRAMADTSLMPLRCCKQGFDDAFVPAVLSQSAARRYR